jgi:aminoglycoside phosphotransferase (APT) family kinase protein
MSRDAAEDLLAGTGGMTSDSLSLLVREINERAGCDLRLVGTADHGGSGGAAYARWPDGREAVVTRSPSSVARMRQTADVLSSVKAHGVPVPRHDVVVELADSTVALVQERLDGRPASQVDASVIDSMVELNERFAGLLADRPDVPIPPLYLRESGPVYPRHDVLERNSDRSRRLLRRIREIGAGEPHEMTGDDLVHPDYTFGNVLYDKDGKVSGVVDWNWGVGRGDRRFALVRIYVDLYWSTLGHAGGEYGVQQSAFTRLDEVLDARLEPQLLRMYWAHTTLNQLHWAILYHNPEVVDLFLRFGESRL